jgi:hypothetical protein
MLLARRSDIVVSIISWCKTRRTMRNEAMISWYTGMVPMKEALICWYRRRMPRIEALIW